MRRPPARRRGQPERSRDPLHAASAGAAPHSVTLNLPGRHNVQTPSRQRHRLVISCRRRRHSRALHGFQGIARFNLLGEKDSARSGAAVTTMAITRANSQRIAAARAASPSGRSWLPSQPHRSPPPSTCDDSPPCCRTPMPCADRGLRRRRNSPHRAAEARRWHARSARGPHIPVLWDRLELGGLVAGWIKTATSDRVGPATSSTSRTRSHARIRHRANADAHHAGERFTLRRGADWRHLVGGEFRSTAPARARCAARARVDAHASTAFRAAKPPPLVAKRFQRVFQCFARHKGARRRRAAGLLAGRSRSGDRSDVLGSALAMDKTVQHVWLALGLPPALCALRPRRRCAPPRSAGVCRCVKPLLRRTSRRDARLALGPRCRDRLPALHDSAAKCPHGATDPRTSNQAGGNRRHPDGESLAEHPHRAAGGLLLPSNTSLRHANVWPGPRASRSKDAPRTRRLAIFYTRLSGWGRVDLCATRRPRLAARSQHRALQTTTARSECARANGIDSSPCWRISS